MTQKEFNVVFELQMRKCADILAYKKKEYTGDNLDRLSAFKIAAALQNCDPKGALAGMMSKHIVSLYDMCYSTLLHFDMEQWDEKITDCINYLILLKALIKEEQSSGSSRCTPICFNISAAILYMISSQRSSPVLRINGAMQTSSLSGAIPLK